MKTSQYSRAFTIPELLVSMTILSILATVAFVSYMGYTQSTRDSVRKTDVKNIHTVVGLYKVHSWIYPKPTASHDVVYNWYVLWEQGVFGSWTQAEIWKISWDLTDPKFWNQYTYSRSSAGKEYQLGVVYERTEIAPDNPNFALNVVSQTYASENPIVHYDPSGLAGMKFWYDGKDIDADGTIDTQDTSMPNVGVVDNVTSTDFTPFYFDRVVWLDSQDINGDGSTPVDGSHITTWTNKTGWGFNGFVPQTGNNHSSPSASTAPTYQNTGFSGKPGVYFNGVYKWDRIVVDRGWQPKGKPFSLAYTFKINDAGWNSAENVGTNHATIISVGPTGGGQYYTKPGGWQLSRDGRKNNFIFRINGSITSRTYFNGANCNGDWWGNTCGNSWINAEVAFGDWSEVNDNTVHTVFVTYEWNRVTGYLDGTKRFEATMSSATKPYGEYFRFFGNRAGTAYLEGMLWEVFIANDRMSLQDLEKIEWYFARRWDWLDDLPAGHPYKTTPPKMDAFSQLSYSRYSNSTVINNYNRATFFATNPSLLNAKTVRFPGSMPDINIEENNKTHIWRGPIKVSATWNYTFTLTSDDYSFITIDDAIVVNNGGAHLKQTQSWTIYLEKDTLYNFELVYWELTWEAFLDYRVEWPGVIGYRKYEAFSWQDKSAFNRDINQVIPENQPNYNPLTFSFDFTPSQYFNFPSDPFSGTDNFDVFAVWEIDSDGTSPNLDGYILENIAGWSGQILLGWEGMSLWNNSNSGPGIKGTDTQLTSYSLNRWALLHKQQKFFMRGQLFYQGKSDLTTINSPFFLGGKESWFTGKIKEVIGYNQNINENDRKQIEWYLSHKWGIAYKLPVDHPYYEPLDTGEQIHVQLSGKYNGLFTQGVLGNTYVVVASPSMMSSLPVNPGGSVDITTIIGENRLVYNGYNNIPASYTRVDAASKKLTTKNWFFFPVWDPKVFEWEKQKLANYVWISQVDRNIRNIYAHSYLYPYVSDTLSDYTPNYVKDILGEVIWLNPITPYYCKDILEVSKWINISVHAEVLGSSGDDVSEWIMSITDGDISGVGDYSYLTTPGDNPEITFDWWSFQNVSLVRIHNAFWPYSQNLWWGVLELLDEDDNVIYTHTFWNTLGVSTIEVPISLGAGSEIPTKMKIRPSLDYSQIALREIEVYAWDDLSSWVYKVDDDGIGWKSSYKVYCDMDTDGGGWTRIWENFINNSTFINQIHPDNYTLSSPTYNILRTDIALPSSVNQWSVLHQTWTGGVSYDLYFTDIPNVEFTSSIRLGAWVKGTVNSIFKYRIKYTNNTIIDTAPAQLIKSDGSWRYYETKIPITDIVENFTWSLGWEIDKWSWIDITDLDMSIYYK